MEWRHQRHVSRLRHPLPRSSTRSARLARRFFCALFPTKEPGPRLFIVPLHHSSPLSSGPLILSTFCFDLALFAFFLPLCYSAILSIRHSLLRHCAIPQHRHSASPPHYQFSISSLFHSAKSSILHSTTPPLRHAANFQSGTSPPHSTISPCNHSAPPSIRHFANPLLYHSSTPPLVHFA